MRQFNPSGTFSTSAGCIGGTTPAGTLDLSRPLVLGFAHFMRHRSVGHIFSEFGFLDANNQWRIAGNSRQPKVTQPGKVYGPVALGAKHFDFKRENVALLDRGERGAMISPPCR